MPINLQQVAANCDVTDFVGAAATSPDAVSSAWRHIASTVYTRVTTQGAAAQQAVPRFDSPEGAGTLPWHPDLGSLAKRGKKLGLGWAVAYEAIYAEHFDTEAAAQVLWQRAETTEERRQAAVQLHQYQPWCDELRALDPTELGELLADTQDFRGIERLDETLINEALATQPPVVRCDVAGEIACLGGPVDWEALQSWLAGPASNGGKYRARSSSSAIERVRNRLADLLHDDAPRAALGTTLWLWAHAEARAPDAGLQWLEALTDQALAQFHGSWDGEVSHDDDTSSAFEGYQAFFGALTDLGTSLPLTPPRPRWRHVEIRSFIQTPTDLHPVFKVIALGRLHHHLSSVPRSPTPLGLPCWGEWRWAAELWARRVIAEAPDDVDGYLEELTWPCLFLARELIMRSLRPDLAWEWARRALETTKDAERDGLLQAFWSCLECFAAKGRRPLRSAIAVVPPKVLSLLSEETSNPMIFTNYGRNDVDGVGWVLYAAAQMKARKQKEGQP